MLYNSLGNKLHYKRLILITMSLFSVELIFLINAMSIKDMKNAEPLRMKLLLFVSRMVILILSYMQMQ